MQLSVHQTDIVIKSFVFIECTRWIDRNIYPHLDLDLVNRRQPVQTVNARYRPVVFPFPRR